MKISDSLLPEFDHEMASTRKTLERAPLDKFDWKPHEKSMGLGYMASHLANLPSWATLSINTDSFDMAPKDQPPMKTPEAHSTEELLGMFDKNVADARAAIAQASNEDLFKPWSLLAGGNVILTMPKVAVIRSFVMNHIIHHRAQLGVYLRLNDIAVPSIYGPSADEAM